MRLTTTKSSCIITLQPIVVGGGEVNAIKTYREKRGLSQAAISDALNVSQQAVAKWESGEASPRADKLPALARLLGVSVGALFEDSKTDAQSSV